MLSSRMPNEVLHPKNTVILFYSGDTLLVLYLSKLMANLG